MNLTPPPPSQNSHAVLQLLSESSRQQCKWWERDLSNTHTQAECRRQRRLCWRQRCGSCQAVGGTSVCCDWWVMWHCHVARPGSSLPHPVTPVTLMTLHHTRQRASFWIWRYIQTAYLLDTTDTSASLYTTSMSLIMTARSYSSGVCSQHDTRGNTARSYSSGAHLSYPPFFLLPSLAV